MPDLLLVVIAEDNHLVRECTRRLLEDSGEVAVIAALHLSASTVDKHVHAIFGRLALGDAPVHRRVSATKATAGVLTFLKEAPPG